MENKSVWQRKTKKYPKLEKDVDRDIVVVGGGIAGYLTAFRLAEAGQKVTLAEADRLFSGTTGRTTAKITANQGSVYSELFQRYGTRAAALYYRSQLDGMQGYEKLVRQYEIDCDWEECDGYIFSKERRYEIEKLYRAMRRAGAECELAEGTPLLKDSLAVKTEKQYLFDPLKFLSALPVKFEIFEETRAVDIDAKKKIIRTDGGVIRAEKIVVATHYPIINAHGGYFMKLRQSMSYTIAVNEKLAEDMYLDEREDGLSVRPYAKGTLLGGGDHRTGRTAGGHFGRLEKTAETLFGAKNVTHRWCAEDVMTFDGMPMAGKYAKSLDGVYVTTGFNKWGMTNSMVCASVLTDLILGKENPYAELFSPQRHIKKSFGDFVSNALTNVSGIFLGYCRVPMKTAKDVPAGRGMIVYHHGKKRAVYRDLSGELHVIGNKCPHMHCELKWNGETNTWDCPCHGSRFDIYGNVLAEPSTKSCKYKCEGSHSPESPDNPSD